MDPVTAYECRHKIKSGAVCNQQTALLDWLMENHYEHMVMFLDDRRHRYGPGIAEEAVVRWAQGHGYPVDLRTERRKRIATDWAFTIVFAALLLVLIYITYRVGAAIVENVGFI